MAKWLIKTEPQTWSWNDQLKKQTTQWDGVRNFQAANHLRAMKLGDLAFFYHSGEEKRIVGIVEIIKEFYPDPTDLVGKFVMVDVKAIESLRKPVTLATIKSLAQFQFMPLVRQPRLSVMPVTQGEWDNILQLAR